MAYGEGTYNPRLRSSGLRSKVFHDTFPWTSNCIRGGTSQGLKQRGFCHEALDKSHLDLKVTLLKKAANKEIPVPKVKSIR